MVSAWNGSDPDLELDPDSDQNWGKFQDQDGLYKNLSVACQDPSYLRKISKIPTEIFSDNICSVLHIFSVAARIYCHIFMFCVLLCPCYNAIVIFSMCG